MIGCSKKCGQNYPEKEQRRENETQVKNFTLGCMVLINLRACLHGGGGP